MNLSLYVSHSKEDGEIAERIKHWLEERLPGAVNVVVSGDGSTVEDDDPSLKTVASVLRSSRVVLVLCTPASAQHRGVLFEAGGAYCLGAKVIAVCAGGLHPEQLDSPLSLLPEIDLADPDHVELLLKVIAAHADVPFPSVDISADAEWLSSATRVSAAGIGNAAAHAAYTPLVLTELNELVAEISPAVQSAADRGLVMFEYMFDSSYFRDDSFTGFEGKPGWVRHFINKLQGAGLSFGSRGGEATIPKLTSHLQALAAQQNWTTADALLSLDPLLPEAIPLLVREVLTIQDLEWRNLLGWRMQLGLIGLLVPHDHSLIVRLIGTLGRLEGFKPLNSFTDGLLSLARQTIPDEAGFDRWFFEFSRTKYEDFARLQKEEYRKFQESIAERDRQREREQREREQRLHQREPYHPFRTR